MLCLKNKLTYAVLLVPGLVLLVWSHFGDCIDTRSFVCMLLLASVQDSL